MKKKIILFLSFLMIAMCLTGCSEHIIEREQLETVSEIANNVATQKAYVLPEGYKVSFYDETTNAQIMIRDNTKAPRERIDVVFDVSGEKPQLIQIKIRLIFYTIFWSVVTVLALWVFIVYPIISIIKNKNNRRNRRSEGRD